MKPTVESYTVALPWYEREDFDRLWELAHDHDDVPRDYDVWHAAACEVINAWLARGRALQIVTIKPEAYLAWLAQSGLPNDTAARRQYVEEMATQAGSVADDGAMLARAAGAPDASDSGDPPAPVNVKR